MNFKEFLTYREKTVGDVSPSMNKQNTPEAGGPLPLPFSINMTENQGVSASIGNLLGLPETPGSGKITHMDMSKNPITIVVSDDNGNVHQLMMSLDEFRRVKGRKPEKDRNMTFVLQRRPDDKGRWVSQISQCHCT